MCEICVSLWVLDASLSLSLNKTAYQPSTHHHNSTPPNHHHYQQKSTENQKSIEIKWKINPNPSKNNQKSTINGKSINQNPNPCNLACVVPNKYELAFVTITAYRGREEREMKYLYVKYV